MNNRAKMTKTSKAIAKHCASTLLFIVFFVDISLMNSASAGLPQFSERLPDVQEVLSRRRSEVKHAGSVRRREMDNLRVANGRKSSFENSENLAHGFHDYQVVVPIRIHHKTGEPVSHGRHFRAKRTPREEGDFGGESPRRERRDVNHEPADGADEIVHSMANFSISAFGKEFLLHLTPYSDFIAPTFTLHYKGNVTREVDESIEDVPRHCFYSGLVNSKPGHTAIVSVCGGLSGAFMADGTDYLIQPHEISSSAADLDEEGTKSHRIFRRSTRKSADQMQTLCGFTEGSVKQNEGKNQNTDPRTLADDFNHVIANTQTQTSLQPVIEFQQSLDHFMADRLNRSRAGRRRPPTRRRNFWQMLSSHKALAKIIAKKPSWKKLWDLLSKTPNAVTTAKVRRWYKILRKDIRSSDGHEVGTSTYPNVHTTEAKEKPKSRKKRYLSYPRNVEVMVTADNQMHRAHGANLQHYILTLMAIVHHVYLDASIENLINIVLVKLIVIGDDDVMHGPRITKNAHICLRNFCQWQADENDPDDSHPNHHDTAVLITRQDICRSETACDTLGLAELGTMCDPLRSCSINEDNGLSTAFTIAHEIGHEFNAPHDNNEKCTTPDGKPEEMHVMSPTLDHKSQPWSWSRCSARYITNFLDYGNGQCLLDEPPQRVLPLPTEEPGQIYDVNQQCSFVYGKGVTHCGFMTTCIRLWCVSADRRHGCRTPHMPWADGTRCGPGKWCQRGKCVPENQYRRPVDGEWGEWSKFGECSRTCGGGIRISQRHCNNPPPQDGGRYCVGKRKKFRSCNWQECTVAHDFRAEQCGSYSWSKNNRHQIRGIPTNAVWIPKYDGILLQDRCKLICQVKRSDQYGAPWYVLKPKVIDGTPCGPDTDDICVEGICKRAGCDHVLNSNTRLDECGVCGGDNSGCRTVKGVYNVGNKNGYNIVAEIPKGATNIVIEQRSYNMHSEDNNYLALKDSTGNFILNGNRNVVQFEHTVRKRSPTGNGYAYYFDYSGTDRITERINSTRPIIENVTILVLSAGDLAPPNIRYRYNIPLPEHTTYMWDPYGPWSPCSRPCQGRTKRKVLCVRSDDRRVVADHQCHNRNKPVSIIRSCQTHCDIKWRIKSSECSARCGKGIATLTYECIKVTRSYGKESDVETMPNEDCLAPKPSTRAVCHGECLDTAWQYGEWSQCSRSCGGGTQTRDAKCRDTSNMVVSSSECDASERQISRICSDFPCPQWVTSDFSTCLATCGSGVRRRRVWCRGSNGNVHNDATCDSISKPPSTVKCILQPCPKWEYGQWGKCSATCGEGTTMRVMRCIDYLGRHVDDDQCNEGLREKDTQSCSSHVPCFSPAYFPPRRTGRPIVINRAPSIPETIDPESAEPANTDISLILDVEDVQPRNMVVEPSARSAKIINQEPEPNRDSTAQWRMGHWTECSTTCGPGRRERYVSCRHSDGHEINDEHCSVNEGRPAGNEICDPGPCSGVWRAGDWTECPVSCGEGTRTRYVWCTFGGQYSPESMCDGASKPATETSCQSNILCPPTHTRVHEEPIALPDIVSPVDNAETDEIPVSLDPSSVWRTGPWSQCSSSCGSGNQKRAVVCYGECGDLPKPPVIRLCEAGPCPKWSQGEWSECSTTCGNGVKRRDVRCTMGTEATDDSRCDVLNRPSDALPCNERSCPGRGFRWRTTRWSGCSVSCGKGTKQRSVVCTDRKKNRVSDQFCESLRGRKPTAIRKCRTRRRCPRWHTGKWNECSKICGSGVRVRGVHCRYKRQTLDDDFCDSATKPEDVERCNGTKCDYYKWVVTSWTTCSTSCGDGVMRRYATCVDGRNARVADSSCEATTARPATSQSCSRGPCESYWHVEPWSRCSRTCGRGIETRQVKCMHVSKETYALMAASNCDSQKKPYHVRDCNLNNCDSDAHWRVGPWNECSASCDEGVSARLVVCFSRIRQTTISEASCLLATPKPERTRRCKRVLCPPTTCRHVQQHLDVSSDGEFFLQLRGQMTKIYCKDMNTVHPTEYVTLTGGAEENFSEIYGFSLNDSESCPHNGTRNDECACTRNPQAGKTTFEKIRLDVRSMKVNVNDYTFASFVHGRPVGYGVAGDCYSRFNCPQGAFRINLAGTGLAVSTSTRWSSYGRSAVQKISRNDDNVAISGTCGGYCGQCRPDPIAGLILTHFPER